MAAGRTAVVVTASGLRTGNRYDNAFRNFGDFVDRSLTPVEDAIDVPGAPLKIVWCRCLMTSVATHCRVALTERVGHIPVAGDIAISSIAGHDHLSVPDLGDPHFKIHLRIFSRSFYACLHTTERRQLGQRGASAWRCETASGLALDRLNRDPIPDKRTEIG